MNPPSLPKLRILRNTRSGYTLMEIMLVLAIIAVLVGSAAYMLVGKIDFAKDQRVTADIQTITTGLRTYEMTNFKFPTTEQGLDALVEKPTVAPEPQRWYKFLEKLPRDPWGNIYQYESNGSTFRIWSLGPDGKPGGDDDLPAPEKRS
jgi:general secretion pathway protein G